MPRVKINSVSLNYELTGRGPIVVFINGLTMDLNGWLLQVDPFGGKYSVLRYDCRGQGLSDKPDSPYSQEMHAEDLRNLLQKLDIPKAHIIGLSNGGMIAQHFALLCPEKIGALVLVDTCSYVGKLLELTIESWIRAAEEGGGSLRYDAALPYLFSEAFTKKNIDKILVMKEVSIQNNPVKTFINLAKASMRHDLSERISDISCPTLIIAGEEDILIPPRYSRILTQSIKNSKLVILKNCGHVPPIEIPEQFNKTVMNFLAEHDGLI
ncbi:MAG: alpha/beta fold hydrolase [Deltaproteobacteria bacterium]